MKSGLSLLLTFLISSSAHAIDFEDAVFPEFVTSARALAMGNAYVAKADDAASVFYNPAGLGTVRYPHLHFSNFSLETNKGMLDAISGDGFGDYFSNTPKMFSIDGMREVLKEKPGTIAHSRLSALPNFTSRYFSIGYMFAKRSRGVVTDVNSVTGYEFADRFDHGPYAALNISLFGGILKTGISAVYLHRKEIQGSADPNATANVSEDSYKTGAAVVSTFGSKLTLPFTFLPTFAVTVHNTFEQEFSVGSTTAGAPTNIPRTYDVGFAITPQIGTATRIHLEVNLKDVGGAYADVPTSRKFLAGAEIDFSRVFFIRIGYGDGYGSAGLGVKSRKIEFDVSTYAVDTTTSTFRGKEDRRFALSVSSGF
jgi:hypothetical protein